MWEVGDRGYRLTREEVNRVIITSDYDALAKNGGIIVDQNITNLDDPSHPRHERLFIFAGRTEMELFEGICQRVEPPIKISPPGTQQATRERRLRQE